jgi:hypothetical protein
MDTGKGVLIRQNGRSAFRCDLNQIFHQFPANKRFRILPPWIDEYIQDSPADSRTVGFDVLVISPL